MSASAEEFTLLMAVWKADDPAALEQALTSATTAQELPPSHVVITADGPLTPALEKVVVAATDLAPTTVVRSATHTGLARTLQRGLGACPTDTVARADADDLNEPNRFSTQIPAFHARGLDLLGSAMREIGSDRLRERPLGHDEIAAYMRDHNPFQHPTVVYSARAVNEAGGYLDLPYMEDWYLWYRMMVGGARMGNLPEPLVRYRVGEALYRRRGGFAPLTSDITLQRLMLREGHTTRLRASRNIAARAAYRAIGPRARAWMYRAVIERGKGRAPDVR
ncbi:MAG: glycosyltransferase [Dermabacter sp.]|nr:glycosyltransferase [Dermabacter sp.]